MEEPVTLTKAPRARKGAAKKETFSFEARNAHEVLLLGEFTHWEQAPIEMKKQKNGTWKATVSLSPGTYEYRFKVDGEWQDDPACTTRQPNSFGGSNCVRVIQ